MPVCTTPVPSRRSLFWSTQPSACGIVDSCEGECGRPGLETVGGGTNCGSNCSCCAPNTVQEGCTPPSFEDMGRSIAINDWVRGLVLNILMTDARSPDTECGYKPGTQGGHWSESYMQNDTVGSMLGKIGPGNTIDEAVSLTVGYAEAAMDKLVKRGVASSVTVAGEYIGDGRIGLEIEIAGSAADVSRVGITAGATENGWVWG